MASSPGASYKKFTKRPKRLEENPHEISSSLSRLCEWRTMQSIHHQGRQVRGRERGTSRGKAARGNAYDHTSCPTYLLRPRTSTVHQVPRGMTSHRSITCYLVESCGSVPITTSSRRPEDMDTLAFFYSPLAPQRPLNAPRLSRTLFVDFRHAWISLSI
jgi:hypothetical protein